MRRWSIRGDKFSRCDRTLQLVTDGRADGRTHRRSAITERPALTMSSRWRRCLNHVLDGVKIRPWQWAILREEGAAHCKVQRRSAVSCATRAQQWLRWATVATIDMGRKERRGLLCNFCGGDGSPSNTMWPGLRSTAVLSGIFIHPAVWPQ